MEEQKQPITGSYHEADTLFLLKAIEMPHTPVADLERALQVTGLHYSEIITHEEQPSEEYMQLFAALMQRYARRLARELLSLAADILVEYPCPITIVSLARAGTPVGALIGRILRERFRRDAVHYSISLIRDRGIDENALRFIFNHAKRDPRGIIFVDGWTAKGVITRELRKYVAAWNAKHGCDMPLADTLYVVSDIGGTADVAATVDDYAIPSGILNAVVSGLMSRSVLNDCIGPDDFHGAVYYAYLQPNDISNEFLERMYALSNDLVPLPVHRAGPSQKASRVMMTWYLYDLMTRYGVSDVNKIKPGVAEATRVLLRRIPRMLILKAKDDHDTLHLVKLAEERKVRMVFEPRAPYKATALIETISE